MKTRALVANLVVAGLALAASGCRTVPRMGRYDIKVTVAESLRNSMGLLPSIEVHLVGLDTPRGKALQAVSMSDYWNPNRPRDELNKHIMFFGEGHQNPQMLPRTDDIWNQWDRAGASWLFVMVNLPGIYDDKEHVRDPRRMILPLHPSYWRYKSIEVLVEPSDTYCTTPRRRAKNEEF